MLGFFAISLAIFLAQPAAAIARSHSRISAESGLTSKKVKSPLAESKKYQKKHQKKYQKKRKTRAQRAQTQPIVYANAETKASHSKALAVSDIELAGIYKAITQGQSASALGQTEALLLKAPNYKLLHLLRADLLLILSQRHSVKTTAGSSNLFPAMAPSHQTRIKELQQEAWLRLNSQANFAKASRETVVPKPLLKLADNEPFVLVVDSKLSRLYVYQNIAKAAPRLVADYYVTQGSQGAFKLKEGDNRTPIGAYFISGPVTQKLPDLYGFGALNMDYPNAWDKRQGRTGHGIWLHGTPSETYARAPYASNGCVVLANPDMQMLFKLVNNGAMPIVVVDKLEWVDAAVLDKTKKTVFESLELWRSASEKNDFKALGKLYSAQFSAADTDKKIASMPTPASKISLSNVAAIEYPGETDLVVLRFDMATEQAGTPSSVRKQLYLKKEFGSWKIILDNTL